MPRSPVLLRPERVEPARPSRLDSSVPVPVAHEGEPQKCEAHRLLGQIYCRMDRELQIKHCSVWTHEADHGWLGENVERSSHRIGRHFHRFPFAVTSGYHH